MTNPRRFLPSLLGLFLVLPAKNQAAPLYFDTINGNNALNAGIADWSSSISVWNSALDGSGPLSPWTTNDAIFRTGGINTLTVTENLSVSRIQQTSAGTQTSISSNPANQVLTLTENANAVTNDSGAALTFASGLTLALAPTVNTTNQQWIAAANSDIIVNATVTGTAGELVSTTANGGLTKTGLGKLTLAGLNTYTGYTRLNEGIVQAGSATAFGTSKLIFGGGTLQYGTGVTEDFSDQFDMGSATAAYTIDTNGNNVTFATALTGTNGLVKTGAGTLSLAAGSTYTGTTYVQAGILKSNASFNSNPFGLASSPIVISSGATLDVNWATDGAVSPAVATTTYGTVKYNVSVAGKGVADTSNNIVGGFVGAITSSGAFSATASPFSLITLTGDTTISGRYQATGARWGITNINAQNNTLSIVNANGLSWNVSVAGNAANVRDIKIEQGHVYADNVEFGDNNYSIFVNSNVTPGGATARGELRNYFSTKTIAKKIVLAGGILQSEGNSTNNVNNVASTWTLSGQMTLNVGLQAQLNRINSTVSNRDIRVSGQMTGNGGFEWEGTVTSYTNNAVVIPRYSVLSLTNSTNDFTGAVTFRRGIIRMSDGTAHGKLGAGSNAVNFTTTEMSILDLFGTSQNIGALTSAAATSSFVQNNRTNTTSTLTVGNGNTGGSFSGVLRDYGVLPDANASATNVAYTGDGAAGAVLALRKTGTGTQILNGVSTYSGGTIVDAGTLSIRNNAALGSGTGSGNFSATGTSSVSGIGSITGGSAKSISLETGTFLLVGNTHNVNTGGGGVASQFTLGSATNVAITLANTLQFDIFANQANTPTTESDLLNLLTTSTVTLSGVLQVSDVSASSTSWVLGDTWKLIDWTGVANRTGTFSSFILPTLNALYSWDVSKIYTDGTISVAAVPEPQRALLLCVALASVMLRRRRAKDV